MKAIHKTKKLNLSYPDIIQQNSYLKIRFYFYFTNYFIIYEYNQLIYTYLQATLLSMIFKI